MYRSILVLLVTIAPALTLLGTAGCEQEIKSVDRKHTVQQSEPQMVSPGKEVDE